MPTKLFLIILFGIGSTLAIGQEESILEPTFVLEADSLIESGHAEQVIFQLNSFLEKSHPEKGKADKVRESTLLSALLGKANFYKQEPDRAAAHSYFQSALKNLHESEKKVNDKLLGDLHYLEGLIYEENFHYLDSALFHYNASLELRERFYGKAHPKIADCYDGLANSYRYIDFNFNAAIEKYLKAIEVREASEVKNVEALFLTHYWYMGTLFMNKNYSEELALLPKIEKIMDQLDPNQKALLFRGNSIFGNVYNVVGEYEKSHIYWAKCKALATTQYNLLTYSVNHALTYSRQKKQQESIRVIEETLAQIDLETTPISNELILNYFNLAAAYRYMLEFEPALENYLIALDLNLKAFGPKHERTLQKYERLGDIHREFKMPKKALEYYQLALVAGFPNFNDTIPENNPKLDQELARFELAEVFAEKARSWLDLYHQDPNPDYLKHSATCFSKADTLFSWIRKFYQKDDQLAHFAEYQEFYNAAMTNAFIMDSLGLGQQEDGFKLIEKNRSLLLLSALKTKDASSFGLPDSLFLLESGLLRNMEKQTSLHQQAKAQKDSAKIEESRFALVQATESLSAFQREIQRDYPAYFEIKYNETTASLEQVKTYLEKHEIDHFIAYYWSENDLFCWGIHQGNTQFIRIELDSTFVQAVRDVQQLMSVPGRINEIQSVGQRYAEQVSYLSEKILWPFLGDHPVSRGQKILIAPDGPLQSISFEGLFSDQTSSNRFSQFPYLIRDYEVSYSFSFNTLLYQNKTFSAVRSPNVGIFSYADGNNTMASNSTGLNTRAKPSLSPLPNTFVEMNAIESIFENSTESFAGRLATKNNFIANVDKYDILHLGVHGKADTINHLMSRLIFRSPAGNSEQDVSLFTYELYDLNLQANLAFLSACETGLGTNFDGEGIMSMGWAFAYAGVPSTVMSLWQIDDNSNPELISSFYTNLKDGISVSESLRTSKLEALAKAQDDYLSHPAFWAAYIPIGVSDAVINNSAPKWYWLLGASLLAFIVFLAGRQIVSKG